MIERRNEWKENKFSFPSKEGLYFYDCKEEK